MSERADQRDLVGRVVVVTGAARGLGRDYARYFAAEGAHVVVADVADASAAAAEASAQGARSIGVEVDVTDAVSIRAMADTALAEFGRIDVLVNNAGLWRGLAAAGLLGVTDDVWDAAVAVNLTGTLRCAQAVVPAMTERGWGRIVNVSSVAAHSPAGAYGVTKLAVEQLTLALAAEVGTTGITVNCLAPGISAFEAARRTLADTEAVVARNIVPRVGTSRELFAALRYLCGVDAGWVTGQTLHVNGGAFAPL